MSHSRGEVIRLARHYLAMLIGDRGVFPQEPSAHGGQYREDRGFHAWLHRLTPARKAELLTSETPEIPELLEPIDEAKEDRNERIRDAIKDYTESRKA